MSNYSLDFTDVQDAVVSFFESNFTGPAVVDGLLDDENLPFTTNRWGKTTGVVYILIFHDIVRAPSGRGRSIATTRLDAYQMDFDVMTVGGDPSEIRRAVNELNDKIVGQKFHGSGQTVKSTNLWEGSKPVPMRNANVPGRFAAHTRFRIPLSAMAVNS